MKQKNLVLMVVAVGCGLVAAFLTTQINAKPKLEMVEVLVAAKDLPVGTTIKQADVDKLVETKPMAKDLLPPQFATTKEELIGKRLSRQISKGETFSPAALVKGPVIVLPAGKDLYTIGMNARDGGGGFVGPGSRVDVIASLQLTGKLETFPLLIDMHVLAVNQAVDYANKTNFADMSMISLAVDQEEALLLSLAEKRGCTMKLLLRHEGKIKDVNYDIKKIRKLLEEDKKPGHTTITEGRGQGDGTDIGPILPPVAPVVEKPVMVKVWIAKENLPGNTTLTGDLIAEKFTQVERPQEYAAEAISDPTPHLTKALVHGISKGSYLTYPMIGAQAPKPAPQDGIVGGLPKPGPDGSKPVTPTVRPEFRDIAVHTPSGTVIHRYVKVGEDWKKYAELTPEQAARGLQPSASQPGPTPPTQPKLD